jgi:hypothetical protein
MNDEVQQARPSSRIQDFVAILLSHSYIFLLVEVLVSEKTSTCNIRHMIDLHNSF